MIKIAPVNYANTYPLIHFLDEMPEKYDVRIVPNIPSQVAEMLKKGEADLALIPVAALLDLEQYFIVGEHGIASDDYVASVCLFSEVPIEQVNKIYLDFHSRTSSRLVKWLLKYHWKQSVELIDTQDDTFIDEIGGDTAALVIGDRAFPLLLRYDYIYDLAHEWKTATGLPFVFAVWASTRLMHADFVLDFEKLQEKGLRNIPLVIQERDLGKAKYNMEKYYLQNIQYTLGPKHLEAIQLFLESEV